jgi:hypothetical protein
MRCYARINCDYKGNRPKRAAGIKGHESAGAPVGMTIRAMSANADKHLAAIQMRCRQWSANRLDQEPT